MIALLLTYLVSNRLQSDSIEPEGPHSVTVMCSRIQKLDPEAAISATGAAAPTSMGAAHSYISIEAGSAKCAMSPGVGLGVGLGLGLFNPNSFALASLKRVVKPLS